MSSTQKGKCMSSKNVNYLDFLFFKKINDETVTYAKWLSVLTIPLRITVMSIIT